MVHTKGYIEEDSLLGRCICSLGRIFETQRYVDVVEHCEYSLSVYLYESEAHDNIRGLGLTVPGLRAGKTNYPTCLVPQLFRRPSRARKFKII